ncbi:hypothetical protein Lalb_Chr09g0320531 [Lupinus albus]|uniref:Uncharacterized protein n=1 Tax=Lupinus albus TaxID=3870 RepID=A0A6A4PZ32_LUPAL|nr:hypothetical protein Lalb_Chr09g0320531 [Lupinus albus]
MPVRPSAGGFGQQAYRPPRGPGGPPHWGQRGSYYGHPTAYDYQHRSTYPAQNQPYAPPPYGNYPQHMAPRSSYGLGWEQRPHHNMHGPPPLGGGHDYYGGQRGHDAPLSTQHPISTAPRGAGPAPVPSVGPSPAQAPNPQAGHPQQGYGESKFDNHTPIQHPYGGHVNSQPTYPQPNAQPNYAVPQQYGKPYYGMPSQGQPPQSYGHPRAIQPGDIPYQGPAPAQSYGAHMPTQQPYPYASSAPQPATYPTYGSAPVTADSYNHPPSASGQVYGQQSYGQPGAQPAASYPQAAPTGYGTYPSSQQGYHEQPAPSNAGYGYQAAPQDPAYSSGVAPAYSAAPSGQPGYVQPAPTQTGYEQPNQQSATAYATVQASTPAVYDNTVSPLPAAAYPQYDSTQVHGAPQ